MTWNELILLLQHIPEERREEQAVFASEEDGLPGPWACNVGNEDMTSTYALIP